MLRTRGLIALLSAEAISSLGAQMTFLALPWFVLVTTGSAAKMSLVLAVELLPVALLGIPSGMVISKWGARKTMVVGDAARAPLMLAIPLLHEAGWLSFPVLLACVFAMGCFLAPYFSAQRLILPELVGDDESTVAQANAVVEGTQRSTALLGPSLAGILIAVIGAANVLYVDAVTYFISFLILVTLVPKRPPVEGDGGVRRSPGRDPLPVPRPAATRPHRHGALPEHVRPDARRVVAGARVRRVRRELDDRGALLRRVRRGRGRGEHPRDQARSEVRADPPGRSRSRVSHDSDPAARACRSPLEPSCWCCSWAPSSGRWSTPR